MPITEDPSPKSGLNRMGLVLFIVVAVIGAAIVIHYPTPKDALKDIVSTGTELHRFVKSWGAIAVILCIAGYAGLMTTIWVPPSPCTIALSFLFGFWHGTAYALIGATSGATLVFLMARFGLRRLDRRAGPFIRRLEVGFRDRAFNYLLALRMFPFVPFAAVNIVSALAGVPLHTYVLATLIGIIPSTLIFASIGQFVEETLRKNGDIPSIWSEPIYFLPLIGLALLALVPVAYRYVVNPTRAS